MGCSPSPSSTTYKVSYCSLIPVIGTKNTFKIDLLAEEEIEKKEGEKFLNQIGKNNDMEITKFLERDKFKTNSIFYYFVRKEPVIKNLSQSLNFQPYNLSNLFKIVILATEKAVGIPNQIIEKKTRKLTEDKFNEEEQINFDDLKQKIEEAKDPNLTNINIPLEDQKQVNYEEGEEIIENSNEIIISNQINRDILSYVVNKFDNWKAMNNLNDLEDEKDTINSVKIFSSSIESISNFIKLMNYLKDKNIQSFSFYENSINGEFEGWDSISEFLDESYSIRYLDLHKNALSDNHVCDLIRSLCDKRIRILNLSENNITIEGVKIISDFLKINKTLQKLNLSHNNQNHFKAEGVKYIIEALIESPNIKWINLSYMQLTGCGEYIGKFISGNNSIENIILRSVQLNAIDFKNIFDNIKNHKVIKFIDISMNDMGGDKSIQYIADGIKENKSLNSLKMDKININNNNYQIIFDAIEKNKNISCYSINHNSKIKPKIILDFFIKQMQVKTLYYEPFDKNDAEDRKKELSLDEKKMFEKFKTERPDMKIIYK